MRTPIIPTPERYIRQIVKKIKNCERELRTCPKSHVMGLEVDIEVLERRTDHFVTIVKQREDFHKQRERR